MARKRDIRLYQVVGGAGPYARLKDWEWGVFLTPGKPVWVKYKGQKEKEVDPDRISWDNVSYLYVEGEWRKPRVVVGCSHMDGWVDVWGVPKK